VKKKKKNSNTINTCKRDGGAEMREGERGLKLLVYAALSY
jgi:hypothetical protein